MGLAETQSAYGTAFVGDPMIHGIEQVGAGSLVAHGAQRIEIGLVGSLGQLGAAMEIGNAFAQAFPFERPRRIIMAWAQDLEVGRAPNRGLHAEDAPCLVVHLDRVPADPVFDSDALQPVLEIGGDLADEVAVRLAAKEPHDVGALEMLHAVANQGWIDGAQAPWFPEHEVGGPFGLVGGPIVRHG